MCENIRVPPPPPPGLNTRIFPTTGYARVLLFMFIRRELGGTGLHTVNIREFGTYRFGEQLML